MKKKTEQNVVNEALINEKLIKASKMKLKNLLEEMNTSLKGHSNEKIEELIEKYGENVISHESLNQFLEKFLMLL